MTSDAYTLGIFSSLRLHPTFYVGRLKEYRPAMLHGLVPMSNAGSCKLIAIPAVSDALMGSAAVGLSPAHVQEPGVPGSSTVQAARGSTAKSHFQFYLPSQHAHEQPQLRAGRKPPFHSFITVVLGNQDARSTFVRVHHRSWMRMAKFARSMIICGSRKCSSRSSFGGSVDAP